MAQRSTLKVEWGKRIRSARQDRQLSVVKLAELVDCDPGGLSRVERGLHGAGDEMRMKLAAALGVRVEELFPYPDTRDDSAPEEDLTDNGGT